MFFSNNNFFLIEINNKSIDIFLFFFINHINLRFDLLVDITCIDIVKNNINNNYIVYNFLSTIYSFRCFIGSSFLFLNEISSISKYFNSAEWYEREVFDMFGVRFFNHPDLRRILCDYGFDGFPLRKDFPVTGYIEPYFDLSTNLLEYKPVHLPQELRIYDFKSPWSQIDNQIRHLTTEVFDDGVLDKIKNQELEDFLKENEDVLNENPMLLKHIVIFDQMNSFAKFIGLFLYEHGIKSNDKFYMVCQECLMHKFYMEHYLRGLLKPPDKRVRFLDQIHMIEEITIVIYQRKEEEVLKEMRKYENQRARNSAKYKEKKKKLFIDDYSGNNNWCSDEVQDLICKKKKKIETLEKEIHTMENNEKYHCMVLRDALVKKENKTEQDERFLKAVERNYQRYVKHKLPNFLGEY